MRPRIITERMTFKLGQRFGKMEVIAINKSSHTLLCECGVMIDHPKAKEVVPQACKECSRILHRDNYTTIKDSDNKICIREYNAIELLMFKELKGDLSLAEKRALKSYRNGVKNRKTV